MAKLLVIIPAYNEAGNIEKTISDLNSVFGKVNVLVVNDCSTDDTEEILRREHIEHITLPANLGIGGGVQTGYKYAQEHDYDIAIQFDGDGQHDARYLEPLIAPLLEGYADVSIGSRFLRKEGWKTSIMRRAGIWLLKLVIHICIGETITDATSGFRAVNRRAIKLYAKEYAQDYPEPEAIIGAWTQGLRITEVPVEMRARMAGQSSISALKSVYYMIKVILAIILKRLLSSPKRENHGGNESCQPN